VTTVKAKVIKTIVIYAVGANKRAKTTSIIIMITKWVSERREEAWKSQERLSLGQLLPASKTVMRLMGDAGCWVTRSALRTLNVSEVCVRCEVWWRPAKSTERANEGDGSDEESQKCSQKIAQFARATQQMAILGRIQIRKPPRHKQLQHANR
jgi:hypothetical protein